jgi:hypothetical protein
MGKDNIKSPDFKVPIPFIQEEENEAEDLDGKPPPVKLLVAAKGETIDNPITQIQPILNGVTTEQFFKWYKGLTSIMEGQSVSEHYRLALHSLWGTDKALWQRELDLTSPEIAESTGISNEAAERLW